MLKGRGLGYPLPNKMSDDSDDDWEALEDAGVSQHAQKPWVYAYTCGEIGIQLWWLVAFRSSTSSPVSPTTSIWGRRGRMGLLRNACAPPGADTADL